MATLEQIDIRTVPNNLNREQVMQEIIDISRIPLPFQSLVGTASHTNPFFEWACDRLAAPSLTNRVIDGSTATTPASAPALRLGNHSQISQKTVGVSIRANTSKNVGNEGLARQLAKATQELDRDIDAMLLQNVANVADTGTSGTAGVTAGLEAWLDEETIENTPATKSPQTVALTTGTGVAGTVTLGGWNNKTGLIIPAVVYSSFTTAGALSFAQLRQVLNGLYQLGCDPTKIMAEPAVISRLSAFMFTSTAQIATLIRDANEASSGATAQSSVSSMISDFGIVVDFVPNRLQQRSGDGSPAASTLFVFDPSYLAVSWQGGGIKSQELATTGLFKSTQVYGDYGLMVKNPDALGGIIGLSNTAAVVA
jgi:hypothetical protein